MHRRAARPSIWTKIFGEKKPPMEGRYVETGRGSRDPPHRCENLISNPNFAGDDFAY